MQLNDSTLFRQQAFIDGDWRDARGGDVIPVSNPANGKPLGNVPKMGAEETRDAIDAANRCLLYTSPSPRDSRRISYAVFCLKKKNITT